MSPIDHPLRSALIRRVAFDDECQVAERERIWNLFFKHIPHAHWVASIKAARDAMDDRESMKAARIIQQLADTQPSGDRGGGPDAVVQGR